MTTRARRVHRPGGASPGWATPGPKTHDGVKTYGKFSPDFAYRYLRLPGITLGEATTAGVEVIRRAAAVLDSVTGFDG